MAEELPPPYNPSVVPPPTDIPRPAYKFSVDLVLAAQESYDFLRHIDFAYPEFYEPAQVQNAIRRYEQCWMKLQAKYGLNELLVPPLDVRWVWHVHMLCPHTYRNDCRKLVQEVDGVIDRPQYMGIDLAPLEKRTEELWRQEFGNEPCYHYHLPSEAIQYKQISSYDISAAVARQKEFNYQISLPHYRSTRFLQIALDRYCKYLYLHKNNTERVFLTPTYDIDLIWHTHQSYPHAYHADMKAILERLLDHDDTTTDRAEGSKLADGEKATKEFWSRTFQEPMGYPGCMYRGYGSPKFSAEFTWSKSWADFSNDCFLKSLQIDGLALTDDQRRLDVKILAEYTHQKQAQKIGSICFAPMNEVGRFENGRFEASTIDNFVIKGRMFSRTPLKSVRFILSAYANKGFLGKRKGLASFEAASNAAELLPKSLLTNMRTAVVPIFDQSFTHQMGQLTAQLLAQTHATFEFLPDKHFVPTVLTQEKPLYRECLAAARNKEGFRQNSRVLVAQHMIEDKNTEKIYPCYVVHSAPAVLSMVRIYDGDGLYDNAQALVSCELLGSEAMPKPSDVDPQDAEWFCLQPNERAMIVRNKYGDFAIVKGYWTGYRQRHIVNNRVIPGDPGKFIVRVVVLNPVGPRTTSRREITKLSNDLDIAGAKVYLNTRQVHVSANAWPLERVGICLAVGTIFNLCNPDRVQPARLAYSRSPIIMPCGRWPLMLMTGYGSESPSNKYFEYCGRRRVTESTDSNETKTEIHVYPHGGYSYGYPYYYPYGYDPFLWGAGVGFLGGLWLSDWHDHVNDTCAVHYCGDSTTVMNGDSSNYVDSGVIGPADTATYIDTTDLGACGSGAGGTDMGAGGSFWDAADTYGSGGGDFGGEAWAGGGADGTTYTSTCGTSGCGATGGGSTCGSGGGASCGGGGSSCGGGGGCGGGGCGGS